MLSRAQPRWDIDTLNDRFTLGGGISHLGRDLDSYIEERMASAKLPGLAAAVVQGGQLLWAHGYGHGRYAPDVRVQPTTVFKAASVSKSIAAAAILTLVEDERLDLDVDINTYLPFEVKHPAARDTAITMRMLLTHTSGLSDNEGMLEMLYTIDRSPMSLREFVYEYVTEGGRYYNASHNFEAHGPGEAMAFCGVGFSLAALVAEMISGEPFNSFSRRVVFSPLEMNSATWRPVHTGEHPMALPHRPIRTGQGFETYGAYALPHYPDTGLHVAAPDLARFFDILAGERLVKRVMKPETAKRMRDEACPEIAPGVGLGCYWEEHNGRTLLGHAGADHGVSARMFLNPSDDVGVVTLANGEPSTKAKWALVAIESHLFQAVPDFLEARIAAEAEAEESRSVDERVVPFRRHAS